MVIALIAMAAFRIGFSYLFVIVFRKSVLWIWYAMFLDWIFRIIFFVTAFLREKRPRNTRAENES